MLASLVDTLTIDAIREHNLVANARERGQQAVQLLRDAVMECCFKRRGLLTLPAGRKSLRLLPPLDVTEREISLGVDLLVESVGDREVREAEPQRETGDDVS